MTKRSNGEGTFNWKTINGRKYRHWRGMVGINAGTGAPIIKDLYAPTDKELREKVKAYLLEVEAGTFDKPANITVSSWLDYWLKDCCGDLKERTVNTYKSTIETHIKPRIGAKRLKSLTMRDVQKFVNDLDGISAKSVKNVHGILHHALARAVMEKYIASNPADNITLPKVEKTEARFIAGDDLKKFLAAAQENPYYREIFVSVFTGMRQGELMGLQWDCVDFENCTITVKRNLQLISGEYKITTTKNDKTRTLSPAPFVMDMLKEQRKAQRQQIQKL